MDPLDFEKLMIDGVKKKSPDDSNELLDLLKKRKKDNMKESAMALIAGGVGELLSGDTGGEIAGYGNELAMNRMKRGEQAEDLSEKMGMAQNMARFKASMKGDSGEDYTIKPTYDAKTGKTMLTYIPKDPRKQAIPTNQIMGFAPKRFTDEEGRSVFYSPGEGLSSAKEYDTRKPEAEKGISKYFKTRSDSLTDKFMSETKEYRKQVNEAMQGFNMLELDGVMPTKAALNSVVKLSESGRMTDEDRNFILGQIGALRAIEAAKEAGGKISPRKIKEAKEIYSSIINTIQKNTSRMAESIAGSQARDETEYEYLLKKLSGAIPKTEKRPVVLQDASPEDLQSLSDEELRKIIEDK